MSIFKKSEKTFPKLEPYGRCQFEISGESFKTDNLRKLFKKYDVSPGGYHTLEDILEADPLNDYDENAVEFFVDDLSVGYIPKDNAKKVSALLQNETKKGKERYNGNQIPTPNPFVCVLEAQIYTCNL
jgi:hypothetical protein